MPQVIIPSALRSFTGKQASVEIPGNTVEQVLGNLAERFPELRRHVFDDTGKLRNFVNVFIGDQDVRHMNKDATPVQERDTISIVPAVAGGETQAIAEQKSEKDSILWPPVQGI